MSERIFVVDDDPSIRWVLERALTQAGLSVDAFDSAENALARVGRDKPAAVITDIRMPGMNGLELLDRLNAQAPDVPVIVITAHSDLDSAVSAYRGGAFEYLPKPFDVDEAVRLARRAIERNRHAPVEEPADTGEMPGMLGEAPGMQEVFRAIGRLSRSHLSVLVTGESGAGKELVARALWLHSPRAGKPFIAINVAAVPRELLESELFGHEKGAFTGALAQRQGRFEQANGGTLFLDEIGDMPAELQTRLLRVLQDGKFYRVGGHEQIATDVRIIAATNQDIESRVADGRFREDLFHRLNVIRVHVPPLRERPTDVPILARHFLRQAATELGTEEKLLRPETEELLARMPWPGNVRQLQNTCRWLTVMAPGKLIGIEDLPQELRAQGEGYAADGGWEAGLARVIEHALAKGEMNILERLMPRFEQILLEAALKSTGGRKQEAAKKLGWGRNTLTRKLKELGLDL